MSEPLTDGWRADRVAIECALEALCVHAAPTLGPAVGDAVRYSLLGGGKRLRGLLLLASYRAAGGRGDVSGLAAAVEVVHAYSLVHDDLPAMDDDDMRRGRPTVHRQFGVTTATRAGVTMVPMAAAAAYDAARDLELPPAAGAEIVATLMRASGAGGMIAGQLLDLEAEGQPLALGGLERVHRAKTGALIAASVRIGGLAARGSRRQLDALGRYGDAVGLAFQIADDVLDVTSTTAALGKHAGRDIDLRKSTYPSVLGIAAASARAESLIAEAQTAIGDGSLDGSGLGALARFVVDRQS